MKLHLVINLREDGTVVACSLSHRTAKNYARQRAKETEYQYKIETIELHYNDMHRRNEIIEFNR